jgi:HKD family nuclease
MVRPKRRRRWGGVALLVFLCAWFATGWWFTSRPLPPGLRVSGSEVAVSPDSMRLLADLSAQDLRGEMVVTQSIHAALLDRVRNAQGMLVVDMFLFNEQPGPSGVLRYQGGIRPVARELREALLQLRAAQPAMPILVIVDPINDYYRGNVPEFLAPLTQAGIDVVVVDLDRMRDSNPAWSGLWRMLFSWWLQPGVHGSWENPLDARGPSLPLAALLRLPNFKAAHRKVLISGGADGLVGMVSSANPHDASSAHSNVALEFTGEALRPLLDSELAIAEFSGWKNAARLRAAIPAAPAAARVGDQSAEPVAMARVSVATEGAVRDTLLETLAATGTGHQVDIAMFYLSERGVISALLEAARRGAAVRILLDPNKDAFGFEKSGLPNRQVASELVSASDGAIKVRWYRTHGEQFHVKLVAIRRESELWLMLGSSNLTRRNLSDYNLEANVIVRTPRDGELDRQVAEWFENLWQNRPGRLEYSSDTDLYADASPGRYWLYRFMEATGMSTF